MSQAARETTSGELALLRTPGDWSRAFLAIYKPNLIYRAVLSSVPASNDMVGQIAFTGGDGTLADVRAEMTLWVGSMDGARDLGVCRIRKAPIAGTFYIGYTSEIDWAGAGTVYLSVMDHAILSKRPVLINDGDMLMDGEHSFSDQLIDFDPVPVLSCHAVGKLSAGEVAFIWDASNSWVFDSTITDYFWEAPGCLSIDDDTSATPTITYDTTGNHPVYCTVTAANGKSATGIQFAFRFDGTDKPHTVEIQSPSAEYDSGGWSFAVKMHADADPTDVIEGALAVLFAEDYYGSTKQSIGQLENRENIICWGYIAGAEKIEWDAEISSVEFSVQGPHAWLGKIETNPLALLLATNTPDTWQTMPALNVDRALWFLLHWYSNATALLNITLTGNVRLAPKIESAEGSLWSQMDEIAWKKLFGRIGCDRYGRFFAVIDPQCVPEANRDWASIMTLTKKDWRERVNVARNAQRRLSMLSTSGWVVDTTSSVTTLYSLSMGHIGAQYGGGEIIDQLLVESQAQINELTGLYFAWKNNELEFDFTLAQNNRMVDLWPNQFLDVSLGVGDTPRGIAYTGNLIPRSITLQHDPETGSWSTEISCEAETLADLAVDGDIPATTGIEDFDTSFPPIDDFPDMPDMPILDLPPSVENLNLPEKVVIASSNFGVMYSDNVNNGDITKIVWKSMNNGLSNAEQNDIINLVVTPSGAVYVFTGYGTVYRASAVGGSFVLLASDADFSDTNGKPTYIDSIGINPLEDDMVCIASAGSFHPGDWTPSEYWLGCIRVSNNGVLGAKGDEFYMSHYGGSILCNGDQWFVFGCKNWDASLKMFSFSVDGTADAELDIGYLVGQSAGQLFSASAGSQLLFWTWDATGAANGYDKIEAAGTVTHFITPTYPRPSFNFQSLSTSPTGNYILMANGAGLVTLSTDFGASWIGTALSIGPTVLENCRDDNRWLFGGGANIQITLDRGATAINLIGNLLYAAPLINITHIRFIP